MANQPEAATYDAGVYQFETTDLVEGGVGGLDNAPLLNLANRTGWLKAQVAALFAAGYTTMAAVQAWANGVFQPILGFAPVQQGGGTGQGANKIYIGLDNAGDVPTTHLRATVDVTDLGPLANYSDITTLQAEITALKVGGVQPFVQVTASAGALASIPGGTVVPAAATFAYIEMVAGGGPGGSGNGIGAGAGGAGGAGVRGFVPVTAGQSVTGYAGAGGTTTADGSGESSAEGSSLSIGGTVFATCTAGGGGALGGSAEVAGSTAFGMVTAAVAGLERFAGQSGGNGILVSELLIGGQGGSSMFGSGGLAVFTPNVSGANSNGNAPTFVGAGGSGATGTGTGANGAPGQINIWFFTP